MYFDWDYYFRVVQSVWSFKSWPGRSRMMIKLLLWVPLTMVFNTLCFVLDYVFFPGLWRQEVKQPVFIVGHARSGTTLLHRLMSGDTQRFSYFLYWETLFPSLLQKHLIRRFGVIDREYLGGFFERRLQAWDEKKFGQFRHIHNMSLWNSEEDQFVMRGAFVTQEWSLEMPLFEHIDIFHVDDLPERKRQRWMHHYKECVKRQLLVNGGQHTHLSKNPLMSGWVNAILETFPDAKIVVSVRNPMECIPSALKLMEGSWKAKGWSKEDYQVSLQHMAEISLESFKIPKQ
ncbi:sulfotransferase, partial [Aequoribacter sp.]|uniref:sulfotransferase n=1 Tax=Aequoribacter sp. TaxID=2847771 RepID=UPI003C70424B